MSVTCRLPAIAALDSVIPINLLPLIELTESLPVTLEDFEYGTKGFEQGPYDIKGVDDGEDWVDPDELLQNQSAVDRFLVATKSNRELDVLNGNADYLAMLIFRRTDGNYVYFNTWCDSTGWGCQGDTLLGYSKSIETFWNDCLDHAGRLMLYTYLTKKHK